MHLMKLNKCSGFLSDILYISVTTVGLLYDE